MNNLLALFISESRDLLQQIGESLLAMEKNPDEPSLISELFRSVHTLKGNSGLFEFPEMTKVLHKSEDLMVSIRDGTQSFTKDVADVLLDAMDFVGILLDEIETNEELINSHETAMQENINKLQAFVENENGNNTAVPEEQTNSPTLSCSTVSSLPISMPISFLNIPEKEKQELFVHAVKKEKSLNIVIYRPEEECFFKGEDPFYQILHVPKSLGGTILPRRSFPPLTTFDCYQCILDFYCISIAEKKELSAYFRYMEGSVEIKSLSPYSLIIPQGKTNSGPVYGDFVIDALSSLEKNDSDSLRFSIQTLLDLSSPSLWVSSALRWLLILIDTVPQEKEIIKKLLGAIDELKSPQFPLLENSEIKTDEVKRTENNDNSSESIITDISVPDSISEVIIGLLENQQKILANTVESVWEEGRTQACINTIYRCLESIDYQDIKGFKSIADSTITKRDHTKLLAWLKNITESTKTDSSKMISSEQKLSYQPVAKAKEANSFSSPLVSERSGVSTIQFLKVDQAKIGRLMDYIGEIVVAKNALPYLAGKAETQYGVRELSNEIKAQYSLINRIAENLQDSIMQIRMIPLSVTFQRFPRLVRDLSRKLNKIIELKMEGEEIEVDKTIVEALGEPLIHLVRNSIDHGIEMPEKRIAQKKSQTGVITLRAFHEGNNVVVEVSDDGKGLNGDEIKQKAFERKLITKEQMDNMNEEDAINLIFQSGFSTNETTSEISGRGVGMDAVKNMVEKIGGKVKVKSDPGQGSCISLLLPVSMAITNIMIVETNNQLFGIPMDILKETVRVPGTRFDKIKNNRTMVFRDRVISVFHLNELLHIEKENLPNEDNEYAVCVVQVNDEAVGIVTDGFRNVVDIILKPLEGDLSSIQGYSGTAILGDGTVLLVLNIKELL